MSIKSKWLIAPLAAAAIALSACGGDGDEGTAPATESQQGETPAEGGEETPAEGGETPAEGGEETPAEGGETPAEGGDGGGEAPSEISAEAAAAVDDFLSRYEGSERLDPALFETGELEGGGMPEAEIEPAECQAAIDSVDMSSYENAVFDGATQVDEATFATKTLVVSEFPDAGTAQSALDQSRAQAEQCSSYTMTMGEQSIEGGLTVSDVDIAGADDAVVQETTIAMEGTEQSTYTVVALVGNVYVTGVAVSMDAAAGSSEGEQLVTDAVAAMG